MNDKPNIFSNIKAATIIFLIKIGRYNYYNIANLADKHLLYKDKNGITLLEYILKSDEQFNSFNEFASASKENPEIAFILCKCNKGHLLNFSISEDDLFLKFDNKPLIQIIMKQADIRYSYWLISNIINHPEIVDIIIESKSKKEIRSYKALEALNEKIINKLIEPDDKGNYINLSKYSNDENYKEILIIILKKVKDTKLIKKICENLNVTDIIDDILGRDYETKFYNHLSKTYEREITQKYNNSSHSLKGPITELDHLLLDKLRCLFEQDGISDKNIIQLMINAYYSGLIENPEITRKIIKSLIIIKTSDNPIYLKRRKNEKAYFDSTTNNVVIGDMFTFNSVIIHELTHAIHFFDNASEPEGIFNSYIDIKEKSTFHEQASLFQEKLNNIRAEIKKYLHEIYEDSIVRYNDEYQKILKDALVPDNIIDKILEQRIDQKGFYTKQKNIFMEYAFERIQRVKYPLIGSISDIVDAITEGIMYSGFNMSGHGEEYYKKNPENRFIEILADYITILCSPESEKHIKILKNIVGEDFIKKLDDYIDNLFIKINESEKENIKKK